MILFVVEMPKAPPAKRSAKKARQANKTISGGRNRRQPREPPLAHRHEGSYVVNEACLFELDVCIFSCRFYALFVL